MRPDIVLVALDHRRAAHGAGVLHPVGQADRDDEDPEPTARALARRNSARDAVDQQRDQDRRERQLTSAMRMIDRVDLPPK